MDAFETQLAAALQSVGVASTRPPLCEPSNALPQPSLKPAAAPAAAPVPQLPAVRHEVLLCARLTTVSFSQAPVDPSTAVALASALRRAQTAEQALAAARSEAAAWEARCEDAKREHAALAAALAAARSEAAAAGGREAACREECASVVERARSEAAGAREERDAAVAAAAAAREAAASAVAAAADAQAVAAERAVAEACARDDAAAARAEAAAARAAARAALDSAAASASALASAVAASASAAREHLPPPLPSPPPPPSPLPPPPPPPAAALPQTPFGALRRAAEARKTAGNALFGRCAHAGAVAECASPRGRATHRVACGRFEPQAAIRRACLSRTRYCGLSHLTSYSDARSLPRFIPSSDTGGLLLLATSGPSTSTSSASADATAMLKATLLSNRAACNLELRKPLDAAADAAAALSVAPGFTKAWRRYATALSALGAHAHAADALKSLAGTVPTPERPAALRDAATAAAKAEAAARLPVGGLDVYAILSVPHACSGAEARVAFKTAALRHHPDKVSSLSSAPSSAASSSLAAASSATTAQQQAAATQVVGGGAGLFGLLSVAHATVVDPDARRRYDLARSSVAWVA